MSSPSEITQLSNVARQAVAAKDWARVSQCAMEIRRRFPRDAEGAFLFGLAQKAARKPEVAARYFAEALSFNGARYDAAIELAELDVSSNRHDDACVLLDKYRDHLRNSPLYLDMAGQAYFAMGLYERAWPLYEQACLLQPDIEMFQAHKASCAINLGKVDTAKSAYRKLLKRNPRHQQTHYELAQLSHARNDKHIKQMLKILRNGDVKPASNIYLFYALGKEYEDLGRWRDAFYFYEKAGAAVKTVADYDVADDVDLMNKVVETCSSTWLQAAPSKARTDKTPIFIVGLPRTGTTLTDRILSSHSQVQSAGESQLLQMVLRDGSTAGNQIGITPEQIELASQRSSADIAQAYLEAMAHRLGDAPYFIEKLPENVLYLGFIAKAWPNSKIIHLRRNPMDACFAAFKQSFFRFAYSLDDLAAYYLAYDKLSAHWRDVLGSRMLELHYEDLVIDQEVRTRRVLKYLELGFEEACLRFEQNAAPVATASSVQVREKIHTRSVGKWKRFEKELRPLQILLEQGGVAV